MFFGCGLMLSLILFGRRVIKVFGFGVFDFGGRCSLYVL